MFKNNENPFSYNVTVNSLREFRVELFGEIVVYMPYKGVLWSPDILLIAVVEHI
jgi:hypothetical protein